MSMNTYRQALDVLATLPGVEGRIVERLESLDDVLAEIISELLDNGFGVPTEDVVRWVSALHHLRETMKLIRTAGAAQRPAPADEVIERV